MRNGPVAALDIGSSKIVCFIAHMEKPGKIKVTGIGHQVSQGIRGGIVIDIKQAESSVVAAVHAAEKTAGETISKVLVNISGSNLTSHTLSVETNISGHQVTERDINHIISEGYKHCGKEDAEILHCVPIDYTIDDTSGIKDPKGMFGERLSTNLHMVTASATAVRNLTNCLARCHLDIEAFVASSYASSLACLTDDERNLGTIMLDIGGGNTSIAVVEGGNLVYNNSIALGGVHITKDIARGLSTSIAYAERIKTLYGSTMVTGLDRQSMIDIPLTDDDQDIVDIEDMDIEVRSVSRETLISIIRPRAEEILEMVKKQLDSGGFSRTSRSRIVITGGTSQLMGMKELAQEIFHRQVRIAKPIALDGLAESTKGPAFSTCIGMVNFAAREEDSPLSGMAKKGHHAIIASGFFKKLMRWSQENF